MNKKYLVLSVIILIGVTLLAVLGVSNKLTYLEYSNINQGSESQHYITISSNNGESILQDFVMPYDIIHGISIKIGTFGRDNNSEWKISIFDPQTKTECYSKPFNASLIDDNSYYYIEFDKNIRLIKNGLYQIRISADYVNDDTALAYYVTNEPKDGLLLNADGKAHNGTLCARIYGGDADFWWAGFIVFFSIILFQLLFRIYYVAEFKRTRWLSDIAVQGFAVGIVTFLLLVSFSTSIFHGDETDNMVGGSLIAHGGVLYRDYVTQHPPFMYYLCSLFALFGAKSIAQMRILYYLVESVAWGLLFIRHKPQFGNKMFLLPVFECIIANSIIFQDLPYAGRMVLSDGVQGICYVALLLELFKFWKERTITWDKAVIVSVCVWASFCSAFLSVYTLVWFFVPFAAIELQRWQSERIYSALFISRYWKLFVSIIVPLGIVVIYFALNGALTRTYDQAYAFNREIYPKYQPVGGDVVSPFIYSFRNFFDVIASNSNALLSAHSSMTAVLQLVILITAASILVCLFRKNRIMTIAVFMVIGSAGIRGFNCFHSLPAYYVAVVVILFFYDKLMECLPRLAVSALIMISVCSLSIFVSSVGNNLLSKQESVPELELFVVSNTNIGEKVFVDAVRCNNLYFYYKDRQIVNRLQYILPWYVDWYEQDMLEDLMKNNPRYVVFGEQLGPGNLSYFANVFLKNLKQKYSRRSDNSADGYRYLVWKLNEGSK